MNKKYIYAPLLVEKATTKWRGINYNGKFSYTQVYNTHNKPARMTKHFQIILPPYPRSTSPTCPYIQFCQVWLEGGVGWGGGKFLPFHSPYCPVVCCKPIVYLKKKKKSLLILRINYPICSEVVYIFRTIL